MTAYYNEHDPFAAAWLRELIKENLIAPGDVDERSIKEVQPEDLRGYTQCHFFAGIGGWSYALRLAGWSDDTPVWTGSCPCQPFSAAGKQKAQADDRHLWPDFFRLIKECKPNVVFGEQVEGAIRHGWLDGIQADLEGEAYAVGHCVLGAHSVGAPQIRQRLYWVADSQGVQERSAICCDGDSLYPAWSTGRRMRGVCGSERNCEPSIRFVADGVSRNVDTVRGYGNAIVPQVAATFIQAYIECRAEIHAK